MTDEPIPNADIDELIVAQWGDHQRPIKADLREFARRVLALPATRPSKDAAASHSQAPAEPLSDEQMRDLVKECGLDWRQGDMPLFPGDTTNRYAVLIEAVRAQAPILASSDPEGHRQAITDHAAEAQAPSAAASLMNFVELCSRLPVKFIDNGYHGTAITAITPAASPPPTEPIATVVKRHSFVTGQDRYLIEPHAGVDLSEFAHQQLFPRATLTSTVAATNKGEKP